MYMQKQHSIMRAAFFVAVSSPLSYTYQEVVRQCTWYLVYRHLTQSSLLAIMRVLRTYHTEN